MKSMKMVLGGASFLLLAISGNLQAQTVTAYKGIGSSAMFVELGLAASTSTTPSSGPSGIGATCVWSRGNGVVATDPGFANDQETGNAVIAWTPSTVNPGSCTSYDPSETVTVYSYLQTDSVVGDRCLFNGCTLAGASTGNPTNLTNTNVVPDLSGSGSGQQPQVNVPALIWNAITGTAVNFAGTDIRPEDAQFAVNRVLTTCGQSVAGSSYLGLGYSNGDAIHTAVTGSSSSFRTINFTLPSSFTVSSLGAVPMVVAAVGSDWSGVSNISSTDLAAFLSGTYSGSLPQGSKVLVREPLSGTYNTMEYNVPNTSFAGFLSMDVGTQPSTQNNCDPSTGKPLNPSTVGGVTNYTMSIPTVGGGTRSRTIGTGQELSTLFGSSVDTLGYAFWSVGNFANAGSNPTSKYLQVDGVDPFFDSYSTGTIPTKLNGLTDNVNLDNVANGAYPIWSSLRLVNVDPTITPNVAGLANVSQNFVPTGPGGRPDYVPASQLFVVHSHFAPPGVGVAGGVSNGSGIFPAAPDCSATEAGGDVGGVVFTADQEENTCLAVSPAGNVNVRR